MQTIEDHGLDRPSEGVLAGIGDAGISDDVAIGDDLAPTSADGLPGDGGDAVIPPRTSRAWTVDRVVHLLGWTMLGLGIFITFAQLGGLNDVKGGKAGLDFWNWRLGDLFSRSTAAGGDMGAHVWTPSFVRRSLLGNLRATGWADDWYAGFNVLGFYFPAPSWAIALLSFVMPYNVAFKLVTVSGILTLPLCAYAFGRLCGLRQPLPFLFGFAAFPFLFDRQFTIYGGNIPSTMAGEFSFSISLSLGLLFLGLLTYVIRTGRHRGRAAVVLALTGLSHLLPTIFILVGSFLLLLAFIPWTKMRKNRVIPFLGAAAAAVGVPALFVATHRIGFAVAALLIITLGFVAIELGTRWFGLRPLADALLVMGLGGALAAFYLLPFKHNLAYSNDMGWEKINKYVDNLFPWAADKPPAGAAVASISIILAIIGALFAVGEALWAVSTLRRMSAEARVGLVLTAMGLSAAMVFRFSPQFRLWNARALPFYFLCVYLMAAYGLFATGRFGASLLRWFSKGHRQWRWSPVLGLAGAAMYTYVTVGVPLDLVPRHLPIPSVSKGKIGVQLAESTNDSNFAPGWARYNYAGYEGRTQEWPGYKNLIDVMSTLPCGRAMWEYEEQLSRFGTPLALMLLPYWTKGCIGSMEGLYFESSASTPFHFLNAALLSARPSNPQRDLPYKALNVTEGVKKMQLYGVRYYMAFSTQALAQADVHPDLRLVATSPYTRSCSEDETKQSTCPTTWKVYEVRGYDYVSALPFEPAVVTGIGQSQTAGWLDMGVTQYNDPVAYPVPLAAEGPKEWQRVTVSVEKPATVDPNTKKRTEVRTWGAGTVIGQASPRPLKPVVVSNIKKSNAKLSFTVDQPGVPVLVKISYFPSWKVKGGKGPYRVAPNLMVVIPNKNDVSMTFGRTFADYAGILLTLLGLAGVVALWVTDRRRPVSSPAGSGELPSGIDGGVDQEANPWSSTADSNDATGLAAESGIARGGRGPGKGADGADILDANPSPWSNDDLGRLRSAVSDDASPGTPLSGDVVPDEPDNEVGPGEVGPGEVGPGEAAPARSDALAPEGDSQLRQSP